MQKLGGSEWFLLLGNGWLTAFPTDAMVRMNCDLSLFGCTTGASVDNVAQGFFFFLFASGEPKRTLVFLLNRTE